MSTALSVRDLHIKSRTRTLLRIDRLDVKPGQAIGITGPSGAGKSTFLFALAGLIPASSGRVTWGADEITRFSPKDLTRFRATALSMIFQDFLLFEELTAQENAAVSALFAPKSARTSLKENAKTLLTSLGVPNEKRAITSYSGGERQRIAVARALAKSTPILLADEPTANLHRKAADALVADLLARTQSKGTTLLVASHDTHLLEQMDRVITLEDGAPI